MSTLDFVERALETATPFKCLLVTISGPPFDEAARILTSAKRAFMIDLDLMDLNGLKRGHYQQIEIRPTNHLASSDWVTKLADVITHIENTEPVFKEIEPDPEEDAGPDSEEETEPDLAEAS